MDGMQMRVTPDLSDLRGNESKNDDYRLSLYIALDLFHKVTASHRLFLAISPQEPTM